VMCEVSVIVHQTTNNQEKMNQTIGGILSVAGLIGIIFFGYQYIQDSESFSIFGADIAVSTGDWVPILISAIVMVVGLVLYRSK
jgi:magnesium-transporting ATPase (P-type)